LIPDLASTIGVGSLIGWMLLLTLKHILADFVFQTNWMARGKDSKRGWALPLVTHCLVHGALTTLIVAALLPRLWFLGAIDFAIHLVIDRAKSWCVVTLEVTPQKRWFWLLMGVDQALHHLTGFALSIVLAANS